MNVAVLLRAAAVGRSCVSRIRQVLRAVRLSRHAEVKARAAPLTPVPRPKTGRVIGEFWKIRKVVCPLYP